MTVSERIPLASLTTFKLGGPARYLAVCENLDDVQTALALSRERGLQWYVIGGGSNVLASDDGYDGVIIHVSADSIIFNDTDTNGEVLAVVDAGVTWDAFVDASVSRGLWGIENLAGIPGSVGAAPVQNIGAYGADISQTLVWVETLDANSGEVRRFDHDECALGYRDSRFKRDPALIIMRVGFILRHDGTQNLAYADLAAKASAGVQLKTPAGIAKTVREIRAGKFPDLSVTGTAGSFFKNPTITESAFDGLKTRYPELPGYASIDGVKVSLAWILDHVLNLRGYAEGRVRLFEKQPIVIVAENGATAHDVDALACHVEARVLDATGVVLEREVRML
ncbi:MAG: UDP-N-acetylmuramate dehydrogenase [Candidatus Pacebacteria bacterium]|nr:UDP-N-acetylmuramate dehydrogenase [Candidatus Paceibacterota bacterium]